MEKWKKLQEYIVKKIQDLGDKKARSTKGSGNSTELGDVLNKFFIVECKQRTTKNVSVNVDTWEKTKALLPVNSHKIPFLALENKEGKRFIVIDPEDFFTLIQEHYSEEN